MQPQHLNLHSLSTEAIAHLHHIMIQITCSINMTSLSADLKPPDNYIPKEVPSERYPVDNIEAATKCKLLLPTTVGSDNIIEVGMGLAFPCGEEQTIHGLLLEPGYARVSVDMVYRNCTSLPLPIPPTDDIRTLGEAVHSFKKWPKKFITLAAPLLPLRPLSPVHDDSDFSFCRAPPKVKSPSAPHEQQLLSNKTGGEFIHQTSRIALKLIEDSGFDPL